MQMPNKFTWNLTLGTLILVSLNWQIALRPSRLGWQNNKLKLNPNKAEFIVIGNDQIRSSLKSSFLVNSLGKITEQAASVKNLGVIMDGENSM